VPARAGTGLSPSSRESIFGRKLGGCFDAKTSGVKKTWGLRGSVLTCLTTHRTAYVLTGYDAAGHIAEEVKGASLASARGIFWSCAVSALFGFVRPVLSISLSESPVVLLTHTVDVHSPCSWSSSSVPPTWRPSSAWLRPSPSSSSTTSPSDTVVRSS
jgi:hypothetical protein